MLTFERVAITLLAGIASYVALTVQTLAVDVAVLKATSISAVQPADFAVLGAELRSEIQRQNQWLGRLSDRVNKLETNQ